MAEAKGKTGGTTQASEPVVSARRWGGHHAARARKLASWLEGLARQLEQPTPDGWPEDHWERHRECARNTIDRAFDVYSGLDDPKSREALEREDLLERCKRQGQEAKGKNSDVDTVSECVRKAIGGHAVFAPANEARAKACHQEVEMLIRAHMNRGGRGVRAAVSAKEAQRALIKAMGWAPVAPDTLRRTRQKRKKAAMARAAKPPGQ